MTVPLQFASFTEVRRSSHSGFHFLIGYVISVRDTEEFAETSQSQRHVFLCLPLSVLCLDQNLPGAVAIYTSKIVKHIRLADNSPFEDFMQQAPYIQWSFVNRTVPSVVGVTSWGGRGRVSCLWNCDIRIECLSWRHGDVCVAVTVQRPMWCWCCTQCCCSGAEDGAVIMVLAYHRQGADNERLLSDGRTWRLRLLMPLTALVHWLWFSWDLCPCSLSSSGSEEGEVLGVGSFLLLGFVLFCFGGREWWGGGWGGGSLLFVP